MKKRKKGTSQVCLASSREGANIIPKGPSPASSGKRFSSSIASITSGKQNVTVFPLPVNAMPIMSRPLKITGMPWTFTFAELITVRKKNE